MLRAREPKEDAEPKVELRLWIDFEPFSTPSGNGRFLRIWDVGATSRIDVERTLPIATSHYAVSGIPAVCDERER